MEAKVIWSGKGLQFEGSAGHGSPLQLASALDAGQAGYRPMELLGVGLAGCTAMDVLSILQKKQQDVRDMQVLVHARSVSEHPKVWETVQIEYVITGHHIDPAAVERAMELSSTKYCPAQNMLNKVVKIDLTYRIVEVE